MTCVVCGKAEILIPLTIKRKHVLICQPCLSGGGELPF